MRNILVELGVPKGNPAEMITRSPGPLNPCSTTIQQGGNIRYSF
ncbi:hypothetical protein V9J15_01300 [Candidatus Liberibacter africanus]|nr:hypothetical protein [Candidatus Liberibacter africanus]